MPLASMSPTSLVCVREDGQFAEILKTVYESVPCRRAGGVHVRFALANEQLLEAGGTVDLPHKLLTALAALSHVRGGRGNAEMFAEFRVERLQPRPPGEESVQYVVLGVHLAEPPDRSENASWTTG